MAGPDFCISGLVAADCGLGIFLRDGWTAFSGLDFFLRRIFTICLVRSAKPCFDCFVGSSSTDTEVGCVNVRSRCIVALALFNLCVPYLMIASGCRSGGRYTCRVWGSRYSTAVKTHRMGGVKARKYHQCTIKCEVNLCVHQHLLAICKYNTLVIKIKARNIRAV